MTTQKVISVWLDDTSEPGLESWVVSADDDASFDVLAACDDREEAIVKAHELAAKMRLPLAEGIDAAYEIDLS